MTPFDAYVVVAACNFDDVLLGVFPSDKAGQLKATTLAKTVAKDPTKRHAGHMASDTGFVRSIVFLVRDSTKFTEVASFDEVKKKNRKRIKT